MAGLALIGAAMGAMPALAEVSVAVQRTTVTYSDPDAYGRMTVTTTVSEVFPDGGNPSRHESAQQTVTATFAPVDLVNDWADQDQVLCTQEHLLQASALLDGLAQSDVTHYTAQRYDSRGRVLVKSVDPTPANCVDPSLAAPLGYLTMSQSYHDFGGLQSQKLLAGQNVPAAQLNVPLSQIIYDATGTVPVSQSNALGHLSVVETDLATGNVLSSTDPNFVQTQYQYDAFGRATATLGADGVNDSTVMEWCSEAGCPVEAENAVYRITQSAVGTGGLQAAPIKRRYFDGLDREVLSEVQSAQNDGRWIIAGRQVYNAKGQVTASAAPYFAGEAALQWTYAEYDDLGRAVRSRTPNAEVAGGYAVSTMSYGALQLTKVNALGQTKVTLLGLAGKPVSITDNAGKTLTSVYDGEGNLLRTLDSKNNERLYTYDAYGHKLTDSDPDLGAWSYTYDALGRQLTQTDALQQQTLLGYDILGRMVTRQEVGLSSVWEYDEAPHGVGQLARTYTLMGDGITRDYERSVAYDALGRQVGETTTRRIDPHTTAADPDFSYSWTFDAVGRVATVTYPGGFGVRNVYDATGYLLQVQNLATAAPYWEAGAREASGSLTAEVLGNGLRTYRSYRADTGALDTLTTGPVANGSFTASVQNDVYTFDAIGNLLTRSQYMGGNSLFESFGYDHLNRLKTSVLNNGAVTVSKTADYDELGNIVARSDVGDYSYTGCGGAHRVCAITGMPSTFGYDANGNLTAGNGRTLSWTSFNMPASITKGTVTSTFRYSSEHERVRQVATDSATEQTTTTVYLNPRLDTGGTFEQVYRPDGSVQRTYYVYAEGPVANVAYTTQGGNTSVATHYLHADHLGSIIATTDASGAVVERMSFDAWGKRRAFDGQDDAGNVLTATSTVHGFTGHEMLDGLDLVHMNGRVYDPGIGRFVSADPNVFYPEEMQDYNVYSYVWNNPLSATDPSGYQLDPFYSYSIGNSLNFQLQQFNSIQTQISQTYSGLNSFTMTTTTYSTGYMNVAQPFNNGFNMTNSLQARYDQSVGGSASGAGVTSTAAVVARFQMPTPSPGPDTALGFMRREPTSVTNTRPVLQDALARNQDLYDSGRIEQAEYERTQVAYNNPLYLSGQTTYATVTRMFFEAAVSMYVVKASYAGGARSLPALSAGAPQDMLRQSLNYVKNMRGTAAEKAAAFEKYAEHISKNAKGEWTADRMLSADGSHIFAGRFGRAVVISPSGKLFLGDVSKVGYFTVKQGGKLQPIYSALESLK